MACSVWSWWSLPRISGEQICGYLCVCVEKGRESFALQTVQAGPSQTSDLHKEKKSQHKGNICSSECKNIANKMKEVFSVGTVDESGNLP